MNIDREKMAEQKAHNRGESVNWISVEDKLPLIAFQTVLCFCEGGNIQTGQFYGRTECERSNYRLGRNSRKQYGKHGRWFELAEKGYKVTHWMPLPAPPCLCPECCSSDIDLTWLTPTNMPEYECGVCNDCGEVWNECAR